MRFRFHIPQMSDDLEKSQFKANKNERKGETEISLYW